MGQICYGCQYLLLITLELLDSPENGGFIRFILSFAITSREHFDLRSIGGHWNLNDDVVRVVCTLEYRANLDGVLDAAVVGVLLDDGCDLKW